MNIKIKKLHPDAVIPFKTHDSDFCYDCVAVTEEEIAPNVWKYGLGFSIELEHFDYITGISARPRSSIWKTGMVLSNSVGTIDEDYRGEICAIFYHVMPNMPRYKVGDKIVQIYSDATVNLDFKEVIKLSDTNRGEGGFGSTGK